MAYQTKEESQSAIIHTSYPVKSGDELMEVKKDLENIRGMLVQQMHTSKDQSYVVYPEDRRVYLALMQPRVDQK